MKTYKRTLAILIVIMLIFSCIGCQLDTYAAWKRYPWYKSDNWYCAQIDMHLCYKGDQGNAPANTGFAWTWDGTEYEVVVGCQRSAIDFSRRVTSSDGSTGAVTLFAGRYVYEKGNLVVTIYEDNLFGGEFTELIFVPQ